MRPVLPALLVLIAISASPLSATQYTGTVRAADQFVTGATVTATQGDKKISAFTDENGRYTLELPPGDWDVKVEMFEFSSATDRVTASLLPPQKEWTLEMPRLSDRLKAAGIAPTKAPAQTATPQRPNRGQFGRDGFPNATVRATPDDAQAIASAETGTAKPLDGASAEESFLVNGSTSGGSPGGPSLASALNEGPGNSLGLPLGMTANDNQTMLRSYTDPS